MFDDFIKIRLKVVHLVRDEAKDVMERKPFQITGILIKVGTQSVEFSK